MINVNRQFQLSASATELYQRYSGRMLEIWIRSLVELAELQPGERVLDVACGNGSVARVAALGVGSSGRVVGLDLNPSMLSVARENPSPDSGVSIEWEEGDATTLPFPDSSFDLVFCSQGLQFFPDRAAALREMRRVLVANGRLALCVWGPLQDNPFQSAVFGALKRHLGIENFAGFLMGDAEELRGLIVGAGFRDVNVRPTVKSISLPPPEEMIPGFLGSMTAAEAVAALAEADRVSLFADITVALGPYIKEEGIVLSGKVHLATAHT